MLNKPTLDFSFSGLKTAVMLEVRKAEATGEIESCRADIAASFQRAAVDTLVGKALKAAKAGGFERIVVAGGVGANRLLRAEIAERFSGEVFYPRFEFCTDNGAMIAAAGAYRLAEAKIASEIRAKARWSLDTLDVPASG
jgi:N6-L-threonylcarbamoyladenine synthase